MWQLDMKSKPLKSYKEKQLQRYLVRKIYDVYYKVIGLFYHLKKLYEWNKHVFVNDYDFDGHSLFDIIVFKLKRIEKELINGHAIHEPKELQAIRVIIKLGQRLIDDKYGDRILDRHDAKWGASEYWTTPNVDSEYFSFHSQRPKAVFEKQKTQERQEYLDALNLCNNIRLRDRRLFFNLLNKHLDSFWN